MAPLNSLAALWMPRRPGLAIGVVSAGGAFGQGVMPFLARHLVLMQDWRHAYVTLGVLSLVIMVPLALLLRNPPRPAPAAGTGSRSDERALRRGAVVADRLAVRGRAVLLRLHGDADRARGRVGL